MKAFLSLVAVVVVLAGAFALYYWHESPEPQKFRTLLVDRGDLEVSATASGNVEPVATIDVPAQIIGLVMSLGPDRDRPGKTVDYNSRVKAGDVLVQLDDRSPKADRDSAQATVEIQEADVLQAEVRERQADRDFRRAEKLRGTDSVASYENAESQFKSAQANLAMSKARLKQAKIALEQAKIKLNCTTILAPIDGQVIERRVEVGQVVAAEATVFKLARDPGHMQLWSGVDQADIGNIKPGQKVTFKVDAYHDRTFTGRVTQIRQNAGSWGNVVTYGVIVDVDHPDEALKPYMPATLRFEVASRKNVVRVPSQALRWRPTWEQVSPSARAGLTRPSVPTPGAEDKKADAEEDGEPKVEVATPTVWMLSDDGLVRPVAVKTGLTDTDGLMTELTGNEVLPGSAVVVNAPRPVEPDFVSGFIAKVLKK